MTENSSNNKAMSLSLSNDKQKHWASYINDLVSSGNVTDAILYNLNTGDALASSSSTFKLHEDEYTHIVDAFNKPLIFRRTGFKVNGEAYKLHLADGKMGLMGKSGLPSKGCSICKTRVLLIIAKHNDLMSATGCNEVVMNMGDFFQRKGM